MIKSFKSFLRNYLFRDHKWITRAEVYQIIHSLKWKNRDSEFAVRLLNSLLGEITPFSNFKYKTEIKQKDNKYNVIIGKNTVLNSFDSSEKAWEFIKNLKKLPYWPY